MDYKRLLIGLGLGITLHCVTPCSSLASRIDPEDDPPLTLTLGLPQPISGERLSSSSEADGTPPIQVTQVPPNTPRPMAPPPRPGSTPANLPANAGSATATSPALISALTSPDPTPPARPANLSQSSRYTSFRSRFIPEMMGDGAPLANLQVVNPPIPPVPTVPGAPPARNSIQGAAVLPSIRQFKIAEMESPLPLDRVYYTFHYYNDVNGSINRRLDSNLSGINIYREIIGLEKTFLDQRASVGLRLPINTLTSKSSTPALGGASTAVGDLALILKYAIYANSAKGEVLSTGVLATAPTGPARFAGSRGLVRGFHDATVQPYVGFIKTYGNLYVQGFSSLDVPMHANDVTVFYNDLGLGYFLYRNRDGGGMITGVAPLVEAHLTTPLNHRGFHLGDLAGTPDVLNFTYGINFELWSRSNLRVGAASPVTGPNPFALEAFIQYGLRF